MSSLPSVAFINRTTNTEGVSQRFLRGDSTILSGKTAWSFRGNIIPNYIRPLNRLIHGRLLFLFFIFILQRDLLVCNVSIPRISLHAFISIFPCNVYTLNTNSGIFIPCVFINLQCPFSQTNQTSAEVEESADCSLHPSYPDEALSG